MRKISILLLLITFGMFAVSLPVYAKHDIGSDDAVGHFNSGNKFYSAGKYDKAIKQFNLPLSTTPRTLPPISVLATLTFLRKITMKR